MEKQILLSQNTRPNTLASFYIHSKLNKTPKCLPSIKFEPFCLHWSCSTLTGHAAAAWPVEGKQLQCRHIGSSLIYSFPTQKPVTYCHGLTACFIFDEICKSWTTSFQKSGLAQSKGPGRTCIIDFVIYITKHSLFWSNFTIDGLVKIEVKTLKPCSYTLILDKLLESLLNCPASITHTTTRHKTKATANCENRRFSKALKMDILGVASSQFRYSVTQDKEKPW